MKNRIGIVGGGQLGKMMAVEAKKMGFYVVILDPTPHSPASHVADEQIVADYNDEKAIIKMAQQSDYLTFEIENTNGQFLDELGKKVECIISPSGKSWRLFQDKLEQKYLFRKGNLPSPEFVPVKDKKDIEKAAKKFGFPFLLKARFDAYDGKGNALVKNKKDIHEAWKRFAGKKLYAEAYVSFEKELAIMVARNTKGDIISYPVVETVQKKNICHFVLVPAAISQVARKRAINLAIKTMKLLKGAGVFGIEMFKTKDDKILLNEIAPRVHNSGHYTIEACITSQFEQHIRAICGLPLGDTTLKVPAAVMINILGERFGDANVEGMEKALAIPNVTVHLYGKKQTKVERKMGHITV
ncbi:5-(carboxyamino)imidazole ribonucleotide synthase, partial [Candidatus Roizmanbacteria bacterium RIFCSPHIGHO2_01_FULL_39_8]